MLWMTAVSFRRNLRKYSLAIVSLALAVTVSCLGLSGLDLLQRSTLRPLTFIAGGQIMVIEQRTNLRPAGSRVYADPLEIKPYPAKWAEDVLRDALGHDSAVQTLVAPFMRYRGSETTAFYLAARSNPLESLSELKVLQGKSLGDNGEQLSMILPGAEYTSPGRTYVVGMYRMEPDATYPLNIPSVMQIDEAYDWDVASVQEHKYLVDGIYDQGDALYPLFWTKLDQLQAQVGGVEPVSWVGIACAPEQMELTKEALLAEINERELPLRVLTLRDLGEMLIGDFERFEQMADYYSPVMLFVAVQIVLVNAVALVMTRRRELSLLRTIGFGLRQIQMMLVMECLFTALVGGLLGTAIAGTLAMGMSQNPTVSLTPFLLTVVTTTVISSLATLILSKGSLSQTLRNPAG